MLFGRSAGLKLRLALVIVITSLVCSISVKAEVLLQESRKGHICAVGGLLFPDGSYTGNDGISDKLDSYAMGLQGGVRVSSDWTLFAEALYSKTESASVEWTGDDSASSVSMRRSSDGDREIILPQGEFIIPTDYDITSFAIRLGAEYAINPGARGEWFVSSGAGWTRIEHSERLVTVGNGGVDDLVSVETDRLSLSVGMGQVIPIGMRIFGRWEVRIDQTLGTELEKDLPSTALVDDDLGYDGSNVTVGYLMVGFGWRFGPSTPTGGIPKPTRKSDASPGVNDTDAGNNLPGSAPDPQEGSHIQSGIGLDMTLSGDKVYFEFNEVIIAGDAQRLLDDLADQLVRRSEVQIEIAGHTDSVGPPSYNEDLGCRRSIAVGDYLQSKGVPRDQMRVVGYGERCSITENDTDEGRSVNRRVEIRVMKEGLSLCGEPTACEF